MYRRICDLRKNRDLTQKLDLQRGDFMSENLQIKKRPALKGEDGYQTFSIRTKNETVKRLDEIAKQTNRSRNDIINTMLAFGINNYEITEFDEI